jgi:hypothetical protein
MTPADQELQALENEDNLLMLSLERHVSMAMAELLVTEALEDQILKLIRWQANYPRATGQLLRVVSADPDTSAALARCVLGAHNVDGGIMDSVLAAGFSRLTGPVRDAAADRPRVRNIVGLRENDGYQSVPWPEPDWLWPVGEPFPPASTTIGVKARLNHLGFGAGPLVDEWSTITTAAATRFQVYDGLEPNGILDDLGLERLEDATGRTPQQPINRIAPF